MTVAKDITLSMKLLFHSEFRFDFKGYVENISSFVSTARLFGSVSM